MNVISILENLLGLSPENSSAGSFLQLKGQFRFQHDTEGDQVRWPQSSYWIIGRELLLYHHLDLTQVPSNKRSKVIDQKVARLSPFNQTGYHAIEEDGQVMLWLWDEQLQDASLLEARKDYSALDEHISSLKVIPEPVLGHRSSEGNVRLGCVRGSDEQQWQHNVLVASNWSAKHDNSESIIFGEPWDLQSGRLSFVREALVWRMGLLLLAFAMIYQLGVSIGYLTLNSSLTTQLKESREAAATLATVRGEVRRLKSQNMFLLGATARHDQLIILAEFDGLIPDSASISEWRFQDQTLSVQLEDENLDNRVYLERLGNSRLFGDAQIAPGSDAQSALISMEVRSR